MSGATKHNLREVQSLLYDQNECVTVSRLAARLQISRTQASDLLSEVYEQKSIGAATTFIHSASTTSPAGSSKNKTVPCTVFSLKTVKEKPLNKEGFLYALSPASVNNDDNKHALPCAHEQVLAMWRDMIQNRELGKLQDSVSASQDVLTQSSCSQEEWNARWLQYQKPSTDLGSVSVSRTSGTSSTSGMMAKKKTAVTAASFFGSAATGSTKKIDAAATKSSTVPAATKSTATTKNSEKNTSSKTSNNTNSATQPVTTSSSSDKTSGGRTKSKTASKSGVPNEKENKNKQRTFGTTNKPQKAVGTADDFVGDIDDDEDEEPSMVVEKPAPVAPQPAKKKRAFQQQQEESMDVEADLPSKEADLPMDTEEEKQPSSPKRRPRRKNLVEKTTKDANGYLHTEMQEVWEEIPSDEDVAPIIKPKPAAKKNPASKMKQGSLASFFKK